MTVTTTDNVALMDSPGAYVFPARLARDVAASARGLQRRGHSVYVNEVWERVDKLVRVEVTHYLTCRKCASDKEAT